MSQAVDQTFELYLEDDRYSIPTLHLINALDEADARAAAERILCESAHHLGAELRREGERLASLGDCTPRAGTGQS